jgi:uncharacterized protein involved in exopolysaccharide biosynthesis
MAKLRIWTPGWDKGFMGDEADFRAHLARRRRILSFAAVFLPTLAVSLIYLFTRAPEYRSSARLEIIPGSIARPQNGDLSDDPSKGFLTEIQVLTSRPLVETAAESLKDSGGLPPDLGGDPIDSLQQMLSTDSTAGTNVVELQAEGPARTFLPRLVNGVVDAYQARLENTYKALAANADAGVSEELRLLDQKVAAKRAEVDAFRARYDIVSLERDENQVLSRVKGLGQELTQANDRVVAAEAKLQALRDTGGGVARSKDDPTVADMERRASEMRNELKEYARKYTPQYMAMDPEVKSLRARLDDLEQQIQTERASSRGNALADAQTELASARAAARQLKEQSDEAGQAARVFTDRFGEYKALQEDLTKLEDLRRSALERQAKLEAQERERAPRMTVLEAAALPQKPYRPLYVLDAGLSFVGSLILGLLAVWFVEFFSPKERRDPAVIVQQGWAGLPPAHNAQMAGPSMLAGERPLHLTGPDGAALPGPRILADPETTAILQAANDDARLAITALLSGLAAEELIRLRWESIDLAEGALQVDGGEPRRLPIEAPLRRALDARREQRSGPVLRGSGGEPLTASDLDNLVTYAAYDAALDRADEVTPQTLRHTYIVYLLRQGIRLSDIGRIVGRIPRDDLVAYARYGAPENRLPLDRIDRVPPALRDCEPPSAGGGGSEFAMGRNT